MDDSIGRRELLQSAFLSFGSLALSACGGGGASARSIDLDSPSGPAPVDIVAIPESDAINAATPAPSEKLDLSPAPSSESAPLPAWVPQRGGEARVVATVNSFLSQNGEVPGWEAAFGKIVDDYSGGVFNPYWGPLGAMIFHGGGHSATFDNSVVILDFNDLRFKRLSNPTPSEGGLNWVSTAGLSDKVDPAFNLTYCEYGDGQPGSAHTYDTLEILSPAEGGSPCGSLIRVSSYAVHVNISASTGWAHRFDFPSTDMQDGKWVRWSLNGPATYLFPGACAAYDPKRQRFWWMSGLSSLPSFIRYLDVASRRQMEARYGTSVRVAPPADPGSMTLRYEPSRDLLVLTCTVGGAFTLACLRCDSVLSGWFTPALSMPVPVIGGACHAFDFVPEANKFVLLAGADGSAIYDLYPSAELSQTWAVVRRPLTGDTLPWAYVAGKRWSYSPSVKSFVWMAKSSSSVVAYRPYDV
jgi:hypothetical protein